ncbi:MAG TPA: type II toxin-antitoxin system HicA family toxin [Xanthobacteraceae bacterium]|jgi:predicted RNA binding protein YcfA (HicA-like mRNA interferase family)|nr:type II toxin-antitoxin system HicA family toxin [Xanthobacteraceae bacterium]
MARHAPERPSDVCRRLEREGWQRRAGRGDHVNFNKRGQPAVITVDMGMKEIPIGTLRSIYRKAGWKW